MIGILTRPAVVITNKHCCTQLDPLHDGDPSMTGGEL